MGGDVWSRCTVGVVVLRLPGRARNRTWTFCVIWFLIFDRNFALRPLGEVPQCGAERCSCWRWTDEAARDRGTHLGVAGEVSSDKRVSTADRDYLATSARSARSSLHDSNNNYLLTAITASLHLPLLPTVTLKRAVPLTKP